MLMFFAVSVFFSQSHAKKQRRTPSSNWNIPIFVPHYAQYNAVHIVFAFGRCMWSSAVS
jgi:hypothetical protein